MQPGRRCRRQSPGTAVGGGPTAEIRGCSKHAASFSAGAAQGCPFSSSPHEPFPFVTHASPPRFSSGMPPWCPSSRAVQGPGGAAWGRGKWWSSTSLCNFPTSRKLGAGQVH